MSRYIEVDAYIKYCDKHWIPLNVDAVNEQPTADVIEVKHGAWIELYENNYKCSACGDWWETIEGTPQDNGMNYCPHCGAKMGGEKNEIHYTKISM